MHFPGGAPPYAAPAPAYFSDPNTFRREYASRLSELTVNSRPIIQNLSMIAQDYLRFADIVTQCLEAHISRVSRISPLSLAYGSRVSSHSRCHRRLEWESLSLHELSSSMLCRTYEM